MISVPWSLAIQLEPESAIADSANLDVSILKPGAGSQFLTPDTSFEFRRLRNNLIWLFGPAVPPEPILRVRAGSRYSATTSLSGDVSRCGEATTISLGEKLKLFGTVYDRESNVLPFPRLLVLARFPPANSESGPNQPWRVVAEAQGDKSGHYEVGELEDRTYRVHLCQAAAGCAEKIAAPSSEPLDFRLEAKGVFAGRILSASGVPESRATVRIIPTLEQYSSAKDRLQYLPLETETGENGRFQVAASSAGHFLFEARSWQGGTARRDIEVSEISPSVTDLGDIRLPQPGEFLAQVSRCSGGTLELTGPIGPTSLPSQLRFPIESNGKAVVRLPEGGLWLVGANCAGLLRRVDPLVLTNAQDLFGMEVAFSIVEEPKKDNPPPPP